MDLAAERLCSGRVLKPLAWRVNANSKTATMSYATGLTFKQKPGFNSQPCMTVSRVLESSAANFAGVLVGDALLQIDDRIVSDVDDIKRVFHHCELFGELRSSMLTYAHI